jgi:ABC-type molybdate transport system substrate-binding protein
MKRIPLILGAITLALTGCAVTEQAGAPLPVYAAGSLREALSTIAADHEARSGQKIALTFGASGLLRQRIEQGEGAQVFASADTEHPQRLATRGGWAAPQVFARNSLCALTAAYISATPDTLLTTMLRPDVRLGTSTPKADPSGDYAWALFRKAEAVRAGSYALLDAKALKLTGGADSPKPPAGRGTYAWVMDEGQADVFLTYCTNAVASQREVPRLKIVQVPPELQVGAAYGLTVRSDAPRAARDFVAYLLSEPGQAVLQRYGFGRP